jgi:colanic acid biosynthesis glycosyl transferase WcaI
MRIHTICVNYWPEKTGIASFSTGRAEALAARGHHVTVCTAVPYYPEWRVASEYRRRPFARERHAGVDVRRCPIYVPRHVTPLRRVLFEASFIASAFLRSVFCRRPDLLVVVSPPLGLAVAAVVLARLWGVPYVFHVEDLQPDAALDLGMVPRGRVASALFAIERLAYRRAALVSTITDAMRDRIIGKGVPREKVELFAGWSDPECFDLPIESSDASLRTELRLGDACVVLHIGNMGVKQGLDVMLGAAALTRKDPDLVYVLVGDGAVRAALEDEVRASGLSNVRMIPLLPQERFLRLLATAEVCLVTQQRVVADIVFPSKVLSLLAAAKPVIASVSRSSEVARVVRESGAGDVVEPEDPAALSMAIGRLRADREGRRRTAAAGRAYARRHWERQATLDHMGRVLDALLGEAARPPA